MNHYEILEVSPNASAEVIRAAYKSLMQRYHPDKRPDDLAVAERASLVVQAYEVLSDAGRRYAYDLTLREAQDGRHSVRGRPVSAASARKAGEKNSWGFWFSCLLIAVIIGSGWAIASLLKKTARPGEIQRAQPAVAKSVAAEASAAREIPVLLARFTVNLKNHDRPAEESGRVLFIPVVGVRVGALDAENAVRHLRNTTDLVGQKLREKLADAKFEELIKVDGEQYLATMMLEAIGEATGASRLSNPPSSGPESPNRYGVVEVLLPQSFSVK